MTRAGFAIPGAVLLALAGPAWGHGVGARPLGAGAQAVEFYYASGEPMAYAAVKLFAPGDAVPFLDGRADRLGRFAFLPAGPGDWRVEAEDGEGHQVSIMLSGGEAAAGPSGGLLSPWRLALWLSLTGNLMAAAAVVRVRWPGAVRAEPRSCALPRSAD